ncbi:MAG TPA: glycosyltransferase family 4 protein [Solirubrobacteraceae bacterium]|nr:glycosyltransferase family 4 protein [Solirubrobacteraceae bacterium]
MRILFLAPRYPHPALRGDQRRAIELLRALAAVADVRLLTFGDGPPLPFGGLEVEKVRRGAASTALANGARPDPRLPGQVRMYLDRRMHRRVRRHLDEWAPDVVHANLLRMAPYLPPRGGPHRHLDLVDALSANLARRAAASGPAQRLPFAVEAALLERYERRAVAAADTSTLVAEADRRAHPGLARCAVVPNGVDLEANAFRSPEDRPPVLVFFGNLGYFPNVEPARYVAEEVLPLVRREIPAVTLQLVGARPAAGIRRLAGLPGVELVGPVERMPDAVHGAAVAVLPMFSGTGMKNKVVEAMACGTPVVANATGMEGIEGALPGADHLRGENALEMAEACVRLLRAPDERVRLAAAGRALVEERYSWAARAAQLMALYRRSG